MDRNRSGEGALMQPVILPVIRIARGVEFYQEYLFEDADGPIDLSAWSGEVVISGQPFEDPFFRAALVCGSDGVIEMTIPATEEFPAVPRIGGAPSAVYQIRLTAPAPEFNQLWQGPAIIAGAFE